MRIKYLIVCAVLLMALPVLAQSSDGASTFFNRADTRPTIQVVTLVLLLVAVAASAWAGIAFVRQPRRVAWRATFKRIGWVLPLLTLVLTGIFIVFPDTVSLGQTLNPEMAIQLVVPMTMAIHMGAIFSPDDEPALEIQLAAARPLAWGVVERIVLLVLTYSGVALVAFGLLYVVDGAFDWRLLILWMPPALFISGLALRITMRSRLPQFGMLMAGVLWFVFGMFGSAFVVEASDFVFPLNILHMHLWAFHVHATPDTFAVMDDFWLSRALLAASGVSLLFYAVLSVRDAESLLLNHSRRSRRQQAAADAIPHRSHLAVRPVPTAVSRWRQIMYSAWMDVLMHWRQRAMKVILLSMLLSNGFILFVMAGDSAGFLPESMAVTSAVGADVLVARGLILVMFCAPLMLVLIAYLMPLIVTDTVANDKRIGMDELLNALPQSHLTYLMGKIAGAVLACLSILWIAQLLLGVGWYLHVGAYDLGLFWQLNGVFTLLIILNSTLAVLIGSTQPSRLRAVLLTLGYIILLTFLDFRLSDWDGVQALVASQADLFLFYINTVMASAASEPIIAPDISFNAATIRAVLLALVYQVGLVAVLIGVYQRLMSLMTDRSQRPFSMEKTTLNLEQNA